MKTSSTNHVFNFCFLLAFGLAFWPIAARAQTAIANRTLVANFITSVTSNMQPIKIFSTGLNNQSNPLPPGTSSDPHYVIISAPAGVQATPFAAYVTNTNGCPIPTAWLADNTTSQWVSVQSNYTCSAQDPVGDYDYRTTFELTGLDPTSALLTFQFIADNQLLDVRINGTSVGITFPAPPNFTTWSGPYVISNNFVAGTNTLDFIVYNAVPNGGNPSGLRVQVSGTATALQTCVATPSGLVSWWRAESNVLDSVGANNGALVNGAGFAPGIVEYAFSFNGVNQIVTVPSSPSLNFGPTSPLTVELWAYRTGTAPVMHMVGKRLLQCTGSLAEINYQLYLNTSSGQGLGFSYAASGLDMPTNTWTHLAGTFDGTNFCFYMNGVLKATAAGTNGPTNSAPLEIGGSGTCATFDGLLDEVSIYNRALSSNEVAAIFNAGSAGKCSGACTATIVTASSPAGGGPTSGGGTFGCGTNVTVCATANPCYSFVNWTLNSSVVSTSGCYTFAASSNETLTANFTPITYTISTSSSPSGGGSTSGGGTVNCDSNMTVNATANSCYQFVEWTEGGTPVSTSTNYTFTATGNETLVANFTTSGYSISPIGATHGAAGGQGAVFVTANGGCGWTATSNVGWISITSSNSGTGNGTVTYSVLTNPYLSMRFGTMTVAGQTYTVTQDAATDSVGDGISDWWRQKYFGGSGTTTNSRSCALCDTDGTGQDNLFKFVAGLNPTNPASVFVLTIAPVAGQPTQMTLTYDPITIGFGQVYTVQFSTSLDGDAYSNLTTISTVTTNGNQVRVNDTHATQTNKFYRVNISLP
jgi:hypothetical protein